MLQKYPLYTLIAVICSIGFVWTVPTYAAVIHYDVSDTAVGIGDSVSVTVLIDSENEVINAVEGVLTVPDIFEVTEIRDGNSHIALWAVPPTPETEHTISFAGIIPGGLSYDAVRLFTVDMRATDHGVGEAGLRDVVVLLHDGIGTEVQVTHTAETLFVTEDAVDDGDAETDDVQKPEPFVAERIQDQNLADGDWVVIFATQDKQSGIAYYEVLESDKEVQDYEQEKWEKAVSPYRLKHQSESQYVYVRAVDFEGNSRVAVIEPAGTDSPVFGNYWLVMLVGVLILIVMYAVIQRIRKNPYDET